MKGGRDMVDRVGGAICFSGILKVKSEHRVSRTKLEVVTSIGIYCKGAASKEN